jgi:hypothetical protein
MRPHLREVAESATPACLAERLKAPSDAKAPAPVWHRAPFPHPGPWATSRPTVPPGRPAVGQGCQYLALARPAPPAEPAAQRGLDWGQSECPPT